MADFLDRLVARSRVPAPPARGPGRSSFAIEDAVVLAPLPPATAPVASPASLIAPLPAPAAEAAPAAPSASPARKTPAPPTEPAPVVVRVEVSAPEAVDAPVARPVAEPVADAVRVAPPDPTPTPTPSHRDTVPSARPRIDQEQRPVVSERLGEQLVGTGNDVRTEVVVESRTERVTAIVPQVARPVAATQPRRPVSQPLAVQGADPAPPVVHIHIDRLDVRGAEEPAPAAPATPAGPAASILSLGDYLRGHAEAQT